ncbi:MULTISPECIES: hypothetical protein [Acidiphilium]|jgi:hypothetical protein|uniref:hypothetical protein n=1 Tax=Acidiphilium TaxID=522 RepID=UPI0005DDBE77|nr:MULTISPECIES: hypothetical protein [Acidiphilium]MBU6356185.1 hypothetical protein [Rhodospirillales bacterium]MDE2326806.1 hypothetical protein [Rhodospirillales bacterium]UNC13725.1 hypothetical protein FE249_05445 [Acidiphilium multivorum]GAN74569.1 hypothetical protein Apmu_0189_15 [Acidiphilium multivorum AIU301]
MNHHPVDPRKKSALNISHDGAVRHRVGWIMAKEWRVVHVLRIRYAAGSEIVTPVKLGFVVLGSCQN